MRILHLTTHLNTGGITSYIYNLGKTLVKQGHYVIVASSGGDRELDFFSKGMELLILNVKTKSELSPKIYACLPKLIKIMREQKIELIHSHTRITQVMGSILSRFVKRPFVSTCHGFYKLRFSRRLWPCWGDAVIAISPGVKEHLVKDFKVEVSKVFYISHGVNLERYQPVTPERRSACRREFDVKSGPVIGVVARLEEVKGQDLMIKAMPEILKKIPAAKLFLIGKGKKESFLKKLTEEQGVQDNCFFYPVTQRTHEMLPLLDCVVQPSREEGLGLSILESQASGLPVVATKVGGIPSIIEHGKTGLLVEPLDTAGLAQAVSQILTNKALAESLGKNGRSKVERDSSAEGMAQKTLEVYQRVTEGMT